MDKKEFLERISKLFDADAKFTPNPFGSASRTFTETEKTTFLSHLWELFEEQEVDFESPMFILALQKVQKYTSVQEQATHLGKALEIVRATLGVRAPAVAQVP